MKLIIKLIAYSQQYYPELAYVIIYFAGKGYQPGHAGNGYHVVRADRGYHAQNTAPIMLLNIMKVYMPSLSVLNGISSKLDISPYT